MRDMRYRLILVFWLVLPVEGQTALATESAVRNVLESYVAAWLAGDAEKVMVLFAPDAVLVPHHGLAAVSGSAAIRAWWWPKDSPPSTIDEFTMTHHHVEHSGDLAFVRSTQKLAWTTGTKRFRNAGNAVSILRRGADGRWRIVLQMWGDPPNERLN